MKNKRIKKIGVVFLVLVSTILLASSCVMIVYSALDGVYERNKTFFSSSLCEFTVDIYEKDFIEYYNCVLGQTSELSKYSGESREKLLERYEKMFKQENCNVSVALMRADKVIFSNYELEDYAYECKYLSHRLYPNATFYLRIASEVHKGDIVYTYYTIWNFLRNYSVLVFAVFLGSLASVIYGLVKLCKIAGGDKDATNESGNVIWQGVRMFWFDKLPLEIMSIIFLGGIGCLGYLSLLLSVGVLDECTKELIRECPFYVLGTVVALWIVIALALMVYLTTFSRRVKAKMLIKTTLVYYVAASIRYLLNLAFKLTENVSGVLKSIALVVLLALGDIALVIASNGEITLFVFLIHMIFLLVLLYFLLCLGAIKKKIQSFSKGDFTKKLDGDNMFGSLRKCVDDINSISDGVQEEVVHRMKSERMKTELITNVSHDIKTPLTSIINYVDLLKKEELENETAKEYIDVLDRQSQRLKKLTDDLVEASKAQAGCVTVNRTPIDISELLKQVVGEYSERLAEKALNPIVEDDTGGVTLNADGKLMWRVFDNLFGNVCKYSLEGTRVYIGMKKIGEKCEISITNYSKYPLSTIDEAELFERFVRGDASRSTEGSGLGLSIARSFVELHEGNMELKIDSDLFKVIITLPLV